MASFRRTQSPAYHDRPFLVQSPSSKALHSSNYSSPITRLRRFFDKIFTQNHQRYYYYSKKQPWKRSFYRFLFFFLIGFLLGLTPFGSFDQDFKIQDFRNHDFKSQQSSVNVVIRENVVMETVNQNKPVEVVDEGEGEGEGEGEDGSDLILKKQLIIVTPTYNRALQAYFLNRLGQTLRLVSPPILWIVVEMGSAASMETSELVRKTGVMYRHLVCKKNSTNVKDRGVHQRNTALEHIEHHKLDGIVYFADDDNIYSIELFESLREISRFGTWPVAMLAQSKAKAILEGPVCNGSQVIGWHTNEKSKRLRRFHVDMSGFAFNSTILWDPKRWHRPTSEPIRQLDTVKEGFQETTFIEQVVEDESRMEGIPQGCSRVMNWHLHLDARNLVYPKGWLLQKNLDIILPV